MNLKIFTGPIIDLDEDWEVEQDDWGTVKHVYEEILWELEQYEGDCNDEFVILHDKTVFQILVILKAYVVKRDAQDCVIND